MLLGASMVLALPPFHIWPLLVLGFTGLVWMIDGSGPHNKPSFIGFKKCFGWSAFAVGWWFGLGFFMAGLYWISFSFLVDAATFAWMIPFAVFGLSATMAVYIGLCSWVAFFTASAGLRRVFLIAIWWSLFEWLRGWAFTGFPWNLLGTVWTRIDGMIQLTAFTGVFGLSLVTAFAAAAPAALGYASLSRRVRWNYLIIAWAVLGAVWVSGEFRLKGATDGIADGVRLRLIQPNIAQQDKWNPKLRAQHFSALLRLSQSAVSSGAGLPTHVIWPETAIPLFLSSVTEAVRVVAQAAPVGGALVTGAPRQSELSQGYQKIWNSVHVVNSDGLITETYDKFHLVPFGEYIPFKKLLKISTLTGRNDFSAGPGPRILEIPGAPAFIPLICYEAVFPGKVKPVLSMKRPGWFINLTNDAWFGLSSGPFQHFAAAQLRAVEEGIPLIRVANTGITGIIDSYGRVIAQTGLNEEAVIDSALPSYLEEPTWYGQHGNLTFLMIAVFLIAMSFISKLFPGRVHQAE